MLTRTAALAIASATAVVGLACQDSSTAPRGLAHTPRFATASDTGGGGGQFHFVANGDFGLVSWASGDSGAGGGGFSVTTGFVMVSRGGPTNNPQTFLFYEVDQTDCDASLNCTFTPLQAGEGSIPNRDLSGGPRQLRLNTNTATNPNFVVFVGSRGPVSVTWQANGLFQNALSGTSSLTSGTFTERSQGNSSSVSADASGTVIAVTIDPNQGASIGKNHTVIIDISR